ncbi:TPA: hypothetical protein ACK3JH_001248 [Mannheimia haemolytica]
MTIIINLDDKLQKKFDLLNLNKPTKNVEQESHRIELCKVTINTLLYLKKDRKKILPYSFENFLTPMEKYLNNDEKLIDDISYLICATFLKECYLYKKRIDNNVFKESDVYRVWGDFKKLDISISDDEVFNRDFYNNLKSDDSVLDIIYYCLSIQNVKVEDSNRELNAHKLECIKDINNRKQVLDKELDKFETDVKLLAGKVENLAVTLEKQKTAFNFVGLSQGFENLLSQKNKAKWASFTLMIIIFLLLVLVPVSFIGGRFLNWFSEYNITWNEIGWEQMLPILGLEILFAYFFRVVLSHYNSIQTQIMQLELRQSLCQFIQNYADYAKDIKEKDGSSLEKFESLIFSSILSSADKVPSTFDGLEQMSNLIKSIKSGN